MPRRRAERRGPGTPERRRARASGFAVRKNLKSAFGKTTLPMSRPSSTQPFGADAPICRWCSTITRRTSETVETTEQFVPALEKALKTSGIRLIHCKTDVEQISNATTISKIREKSKA